MKSIGVSNRQIDPSEQLSAMWLGFGNGSIWSVTKTIAKHHKS